MIHTTGLDVGPIVGWHIFPIFAGCDSFTQLICILELLVIIEMCMEMMQRPGIILLF